MKMNSNEIDRFRTDFASALGWVEQKYGVKINIGRISYNTAGFRSKLEVHNIDENTGVVIQDPSIEIKAARAFRMHGKDPGVQPIIGGKFIMTNGKIITISGYNSRNSRYPVLYSSYGQNYKCSIQAIRERV